MSNVKSSKRLQSDALSATGTHQRSEITKHFPFQAQGPYKEFPIRPTSQTSKDQKNYRDGKLGPIRALYNEHDQSVFDVAYHDPNLRKPPPKGPGHTSEYPFSLSRYHPAPDYKEVPMKKP